MSTPYGGNHRIRTSDTEREEVVSVLRSAMGEGRLSLQEGEERIAAAYAATYRDELRPLTADLPDDSWRALADSPRVREARAEANRHLRRHASAVALVAGVLLALFLLSGAHLFWPVIPLLFLTFGLLRVARWRRFGPPPYGRFGPRSDSGYRPHWDR
ncbi:MAG TPA: DUF1707 domain-containing protein [Micromonosporaceae bacterium]